MIFNIIFSHILMIDILSISCKITPRWMPFDFFGNKSTLRLVMPNGIKPLITWNNDDQGADSI